MEHDADRINRIRERNRHRIRKLGSVFAQIPIVRRMDDLERRAWKGKLTEDDREGLFAFASTSLQMIDRSRSSQDGT